MNAKRLGYVALITVLIIAGTWHIGQGLYIHAKALLAQELLEHAWDSTRQGEARATPWPWADTWPVARMRVPSQNINLIVLAGDSGRTLAFGPGHNFGSAALGKSGNSYISGHRDTHFRFLEYLQIGDVIYIDTPQGEQKTYRVEQATIVDAAAAWVESEPHISRLSLITCYPFEAIVPGGRQRYIITAVEVDPEADGFRIYKDKPASNRF